MTIPFDLRLKTPVGRVGGRVLLPERMRLGELAWSLLQLDDQLIAQAVRFDLRNHDRAISCARGCGACCRQLVPISPPEAFMIADLVASFPVERRGAVLDRMASIRARLDALGFNEKFRTEHFKAVAVEYFRLGESCPFLEDEACTIHGDRPFVCREFLVTTPAALCGDIVHFGAVRAVPLSVRMTDAMSRLTGELFGNEATAIPLVGAVEWAIEHREEGQRQFESVPLLKRLVEILHDDIQSPAGTSEESSRP